jgi:hypothetical protein
VTRQELDDASTSIVAEGADLTMQRIFDAPRVLVWTAGPERSGQETTAIRVQQMRALHQCAPYGRADWRCHARASISWSSWRASLGRSARHNRRHPASPGSEAPYPGRPPRAWRS